MPVKFEVPEQYIALVTIDRPEARNALDPETFTQLADACQRAEDDDEIRVVVLTGAGDKAFCAGADLKATIGQRGPVRWRRAQARQADPVCARHGDPPVGESHRR